MLISCTARVVISVTLRALRIKWVAEPCVPAVNIENMGEDNPTRATRFPNDMDEKFVEYRDERDMTSSEALRTLVRQGLEAEQRAADEPTASELQKELRELRERQRTPLEEGGYLFASVVAGTSPMAMILLTATVSTPLAFAGGVAVALAGLLVGAATKIVADNQIRSGRRYRRGVGGE